jgi:hypothetical protein
MTDDYEPPHPADTFDGGGGEVVQLRRAANTNGRRRKPPSASPPSELPVIRTSARLHEDVDASVAALAADPDLFQRDAQLVRTVRVTEADAERERLTAGTPTIRSVPLATLRERLTRAAHFERFDGRAQQWLPTMPSNHIVSAVHERGEWPSVRPLLGVIETPSMRADGSLIDQPGYDATTGYLYMPTREFPSLPQRPTLDDARRALRDLAGPWTEFPVRREADRYVPVAALMTLVARPSIRGACPAFLFDASVRGSGKSLLASAVSLLAHGRELSVQSWPPDPIELEKLLSGTALKGAAILGFDNVASTFGGAPLDKVLTCADRVSLRVLGTLEMPELSWRTVVLAGGNNMVIGADTSRRVLVCRLEPALERPEERTGYTIDNLKEWCREHHPRLVAAALTVLRAYVVAGRPAQGLSAWGSYERWSELVASSIVWAGGADVMAARPTIAGDDDDDTAALRAIVQHWPRLAPEGTTAKRAVDALYPPERMRGTAPPDGFDALREALESIAPPSPGKPPTAAKVGVALRRFRGRWIGDSRIGAPKDRTGVAVWKVETRR